MKLITKPANRGEINNRLGAICVYKFNGLDVFMALTLNQLVVGSIPTRPTKFKDLDAIRILAVVYFVQCC